MNGRGDPMWLPNASGSFHLTVVCRCIIMIMRLDKTEFLMYNRNRTFVRLDACRAVNKVMAFLHRFTTGSSLLTDRYEKIVPDKKENVYFVRLCKTL